MSARRLVGFVGAVTFVAACAQNVIQAGLAPEEQIVVWQYLDCIDCVISLDSVRALAVRKPDATVDSLYVALRRGPDSALVKGADSVLNRGYGRDSSWRIQNNLTPLLPDRLTYVQDELQNYINGYRSRAAIAMGWIHTPRAVVLLDSTYQDSAQLPATVKRAVRYALDSLPPP